MSKRLQYLSKKFKDTPKPKIKTDPVEQAYLWNKYLAVSEYTTRRLTFGKHVNIMIKDLPDDYLEWAVLNLNSILWSDYLLREWKRRNPKWSKIGV